MLPLSTTTRAQGRRPLAAPQRQAHARQHTASRRHALLASAALILTGTLAPAWPATSSPYTRDPRLRPLQEFWAQLVTFLQPQLSESFAPLLVAYGPAEVLPSGAPGDPALEYDRRKAGKCGAFTSGFAAPYPLCPLVPGQLPRDATARDCCRHLAYAVPRRREPLDGSQSRYAFAAIDRQTCVVFSPRLALADPATWQGVLVHEIGHAIDFRAFPDTYRLPKEPPLRSAEAAAALAAIAAEEADAELRADRMANALLIPLLGRQLCYDGRTSIQALVPQSTACLPDAPAGAAGAVGSPAGWSAVGNAADVVYMQHFPHPPVSVAL